LELCLRELSRSHVRANTLARAHPLHIGKASN
jgi:hypothetical protein